MIGGYPGAKVNAYQGTSVVENPSGRGNIITSTPPPAVNFYPNGGGAALYGGQSGTTVVRTTPDGKIVETYTGLMNMPSSVEQRLSNLDAQLKMLRDEVQKIRSEMHSGQPNGPRSEKENPFGVKPSVSVAK